MSKVRAIPSGLSIARLRAGFLLLGVILLGGLGFLSKVVQDRLEEARRDREEMVALRVFDELEREASAFLDSESERPAYANLKDTDPQSWAPFVVGYFKRSSWQTEQVPADGATSENERRITWALAQVEEQLTVGSQGKDDSELDELGAPHPAAESESARRPMPAPVPSAPVSQKKGATGTEMIDSLNRTPERRRGVKKPSASPSEAPDDQFLDYKKQF